MAERYFIRQPQAGGMLTEARVDADQIRDLVFGLGLNINSPAPTGPRISRAAPWSLAESRKHRSISTASPRRCSGAC